MRRSASSPWSLWSFISQSAGIRGGLDRGRALLTASLLGATMFMPWWSRGRKGLYRDHDPAGIYPAEDHFRMRTVFTHGGLADPAWILMIVALLAT